MRKSFKDTAARAVRAIERHWVEHRRRLLVAHIKAACSRRRICRQRTYVGMRVSIRVCMRVCMFLCICVHMTGDRSIHWAAKGKSRRKERRRREWIPAVLAGTGRGRGGRARGRATSGRTQSTPNHTTTCLYPRADGWARTRRMEQQQRGRTATAAEQAAQGRRCLLCCAHRQPPCAARSREDLIFARKPPPNRTPSVAPSLGFPIPLDLFRIRD